jgi:hypothetical protein
MRIRVRKKAFFGDDRIDSKSQIEDIEVKEDLMNPEGGMVSVYFRGRESSGILNLSEKEAGELMLSLQGVVGLVGKAKKMKFSK